ncbi:roadblock/LC7 domain-containing protein [Streptomyces sp. NPDC007872]|uniref:roadblock/LC7 domain-containing protein n=1 Tax=Streptomyces sp. NPDC007872 TaxID=3364782 RepID=UPI0036C70094
MSELFTTNTHANPLGWLLDSELGSLAGVDFAVLASGDGLLSSRTNSVGQDKAEAMAAIGSTLRGTATGLSHEIKGGGVRQLLVELDNGVCLITGAGENMLLLAKTSADADIATITQAMVMLAGRVGHEMSVAARRPDSEIQR